MLDVFLLLFTQDTVLTIIPVLTSFLPLSRIYIPALFKIWQAFDSSTLDDRLLELAGKLSREHVTGTEGVQWKDVGIWSEAEWELLIGKALGSMNVPVGIARVSSTTAGHADYMSNIPSHGELKNPIAIRHLNFVLFATFVVYFYRDIYPLATYAEPPEDLHEGWILWARIAVLGVASVLIPLFIPREYVPVDPKNPCTPSPEQITCLFSLIVYTFLDPIVILAYRVPHVPWESLPPLSDYDFARYLRGRSFKHLDVFSGAPKRHIAIGLLRFFRFDFLMMCISLILRPFLTLLSPLALRQLLRYLEPGGAETATFRPWVWVLALFVSPVVGGLAIQRYGFLSSSFPTTKRTDARVQVITEVVNVVRMIKLFGWEHKMASRVADRRAEELAWIKKRQYLDLLNDTIIYITPILVIVVTFATYSVTVLEMIRRQLLVGLEVLSLTISGKVSLDRVSDFLINLLDTFNEKKSTQDVSVSVPPDRTTDIGFRNAIFTWTREADGTLTPTKRRFVLKIEGELIFKKGSVNLVLGETGPTPGTTFQGRRESPTQLKIHGSRMKPFELVTAPNSSGWTLIDSQENIVFGSTFDEERYKKVLYQCALERDISLFEAGDAMEVGGGHHSEWGTEGTSYARSRHLFERTISSFVTPLFALRLVHMPPISNTVKPDTLDVSENSDDRRPQLDLPFSFLEASQNFLA
ncbi:hypothetical protein V5O48_016172 [Marasmius crinis-equi]|uniref:ABC transmembrane type-1 domain-containing protein n=1 Tax=Marasmius crinis-equi TaxID=585013 RepID=A0ABR3ESK0_9AGAR